MNLIGKSLIAFALVTSAVPATNSRANNNAFPAAETSWSRWIVLTGRRSVGLDYSHRDDRGFSCVRFRNRYSYAVHIDSIVTLRQNRQTWTERVGWLLKRGVSGEDLANNCFQADAIVSVKVTRLTKE